MKNNMDEIVNYAKNYGFVFQGSEIYGGLANSWDYGPLGTLLKENIRSALHLLQSISGSANEAT